MKTDESGPRARFVLWGWTMPSSIQSSTQYRPLPPPPPPPPPPAVSKSSNAAGSTSGGATQAPAPAPVSKPGHDGRSSFDSAQSAAQKFDKRMPGVGGQCETVKFKEPEMGGGASTSPSAETVKARQDAVTKADEVLNPTTNKETFSGTTVSHDGVDELSADGATNEKAREQVKANDKLEQEALKEWQPNQQQQYQDVKESIGKTEDAGVGQLALQKMLFSGKLPGDQDAQGKGNTLDHLAASASGKGLAEGINKDEFTGTLTRELATPSSINQGARGTCAPTANSIDLAQRNPAEYARIANGLASEEGKVTLADGKTTLQREPETDLKGTGDTGRSIVQRVMAPAFMETANGDADYNDATGAGQGANAGGLDVLNDALSGKEQQFKYTSGQEAMDLVKSESAGDKSVLVGMNFSQNGSDPNSGHEVLVTGTSTRDGKEYVDYVNPWGREEQMSSEEFSKRIFSANYQPSDSSNQVRFI